MLTAKAILNFVFLKLFKTLTNLLMSILSTSTFKAIKSLLAANQHL